MPELTRAEVQGRIGTIRALRKQGKRVTSLAIKQVERSHTYHWLEDMVNGTCSGNPVAQELLTSCENSDQREGINRFCDHCPILEKCFVAMQEWGPEFFGYESAAGGLTWNDRKQLTRGALAAAKREKENQ